MMFEVLNASFSYPKMDLLLKDVSFSVDYGEVLAILGPNGAGKTTLLKCVLGLLKLNSGKCFYNNQKVSDYGLDIWKHIGYVPQAKNYFSGFSIEEMILLGRNPHIKGTQKPTKADMDIVYSKMEYLGILHLKGRNCSEISGGELQMVLLARTLASEPRMLILDEPESNLDYANQLTVLSSIKKLASEGIGCIFITHYPEHALRIADNSLMIQNGKVVSFGKSEDIINEENMAKVFGVKTKIVSTKIENENYNSIICLSKTD